MKNIEGPTWESDAPFQKRIRRFEFWDHDLNESDLLYQTQLDCAATVFDMNRDGSSMEGATFERLRFTERGSLELSSVNLQNTFWAGADTSKITFENVDLRGADITFEQLVRAKSLKGMLMLPKHISFADVVACRQKSEQPAAPAIATQQMFTTALGFGS